MTPEHWFVALEAREDEAEELGASFFELGATGVEQRDQGTLVKGAAGQVTLVASFATREEAEGALAEIDPARAPRLERLVGDAWRDEYKKYFHPFEITPGIVIRPPWEEYVAKAGEVVLVLEPGRAFGTGLHESTALVAEVIAPRARGQDVLDVGTGSGILALIALISGAKSARGIDVDPEAVEVARENAARNALALEVDTTPLEALSGTYSLVLANIEAAALIAMAPELTKRTRGTLVLAGILAPQADAVIAAYPELRAQETRAKGEWVAVTLVRDRPST